MADSAAAPTPGSLYPPSPDPLPQVVRASASYSVRVVLVLGSLLGFLVFFLALVAGSVLLIEFCWEVPTPRATTGKFLKFSALAGAVMLFLFLLKGLFKRARPNTESYLRVHREQAPQLFSFVEQLCQETGAPLPRRIYIDHRVNAAVIFSRSLLSFILPVRKDLLVGLGLVNVANLSELKAFLAHELGHFAQSSVKLGEYVHVANKVIGDMVVNRDQWDDLLAEWRAGSVWFSFPAYLLTWVVEGLRKVLLLCFEGINLLSRSLMREMELNADLHAVRLTGSDALISGLWKLERAELAMLLVRDDLDFAADQGLWSDDLYSHHRDALERVAKRLAQKPVAEEDRPLVEDYPPGPEVQFPPSSKNWESGWHTHPPHHTREVNAKRSYVALPSDERSAWLLFAGLDWLRAETTRRAYEEFVGERPDADWLRPAPEVSRFLQEERAEVEQAEYYHGFYDGRAVRAGNVGVMAAALDQVREAGELDVARLRSEAEPWRGPGLKDVVARRDGLLRDLDQLAALRGEPEPVPFKDRVLGVRAREALARDLDRELDALKETLDGADQALFRYFFARADVDQREELLERYLFMNGLEEQIDALARFEARLGPALDLLETDELDDGDWILIAQTCREARDALEEVVAACALLPLPPLANVEAGASAARFIQPPGRLVPPFPGDTPSGLWIVDFLKQLELVLSRLRRLRYKNLGTILRLQERIDPELHGLGVTQD